jgi:hypothetical protein
MNKRRWVGLMILTVWAAFTARSWYEREIALVIGGTYEEMLKASSARFSSPIPGGRTWPGWPKSDVQLRFVDPQYGFITPKSSHFYVVFDGNVIQIVDMYPQIEPLLLDDALKVVLDLQDQWRRGGWVNKLEKRFPSFADTPEWRAQLRDAYGETTYWYAGDKYQATLTVHRFKDDARPEEERYRIILSVAKPWTPYP